MSLLVLIINLLMKGIRKVYSSQTLPQYYFVTMVSSGLSVIEIHSPYFILSYLFHEVLDLYLHMQNVVIFEDRFDFPFCILFMLWCPLSEISWINLHTFCFFVIKFLLLPIMMSTKGCLSSRYFSESPSNGLILFLLCAQKYLGLLCLFDFLMPSAIEG